jgi:uncharacterized protein YndB with AHSA1/START domain
MSRPADPASIKCPIRKHVHSKEEREEEIMSTDNIVFDPKFDLVLDRVVPAPRAKIWRGWSEPALLKQWFAPLPWTVTEAEIELRAGGLFRFVMQSPEGQSFPNTGLLLEVVPQRKIVFTDTLVAGYRPSPRPFFTAVLTLADEGDGTRYIARALHKDEADRKTHEDMGFHTGWGQCLDQLVALAGKI